MRETGVVRFFLGATAAEQAAAKAYIPQARTILGASKNIMQLGGLQRTDRTVRLLDGTVIRVASIMGQDIIAIAPAIAAPAPAVRTEPAVLATPLPAPDAYIIAGKSAGHAAVWVNGTKIMLPDDGASASSAVLISADGKRVFGSSTTSPTAYWDFDADWTPTLVTSEVAGFLTWSGPVTTAPVPDYPEGLSGPTIRVAYQPASITSYQYFSWDTPDENGKVWGDVVDLLKITRHVMLAIEYDIGIEIVTIVSTYGGDFAVAASLEAAVAAMEATNAVDYPGYHSSANEGAWATANAAALGPAIYGPYTLAVGDAPRTFTMGDWASFTQTAESPTLATILVVEASGDLFEFKSGDVGVELFSLLPFEKVSPDGNWWLGATTSLRIDAGITGIGTTSAVVPGRRTPAGVTQRLASPAGVSLSDIANNGVAVGGGGGVAYVWEPDGTLTTSLIDSSAAAARRVGFSGLAAAGFALLGDLTAGFVWTQATGGSFLTMPTGSDFDEPTAVSQDGRYVVGDSEILVGEDYIYPAVLWIDGTPTVFGTDDVFYRVIALA